MGAASSEDDDSECSPKTRPPSWGLLRAAKTMALSNKPRSEVMEPASKAKQRSIKENRDVLRSVLAAQGDGSCARGWRRELDPQGNLEVDFQDFAKCARRLHFEVNTDLLFGLDDDHSSLTLEELAPAEGIFMDRIKLWIHQKFGSTGEMFATFDVARSGKLTLEALMKGCRAAQFEALDEEFALVFEISDVGNVGFIQEDDVIFLEWDEEVRAKKTYGARMCRMDRWKYIAAKEYMTHIRRHKEAKELGLRLTKGRGDPRPWLEKTFEQLPAVAWFTEQERRTTSTKNAESARAAFKKHLLQMYGDEVRALRRALDPGITYSFTFKTLRRYILKHNMHINVYDLWRGLDRDEDGIVRIEDLSVKHAFALSSLRSWARKDLHSCAAIWDSTAAKNASRERTGTWFSDRKMLTSVFAEVLGRLGWPGATQKNTMRLALGALDCVGCGVVTKGDLEWLDKWQPFDWICVPPDPPALEEFRRRLVNLYGHPLTAWRKALDLNDANRVSWHEFLAASKKLRFSKAGGAWRALDQDCRGAISIEDFDPQGAELLRSFKEWANVHFGSIKRCWKVIDTDGLGYVTLGELKRACLKLSWTGNVHLLFDCLDIEGQVHGEHLARSLAPNDVAFLDQWHFGLGDSLMMTEENIGKLLTRPSSKQFKRQRAAEVAAITARLTMPVLPRGLSMEDLVNTQSQASFALPAIASTDFATSSSSWLDRGLQTGASASQFSSTGTSFRKVGSTSMPDLLRRVDNLLKEERFWG